MTATVMAMRALGRPADADRALADLAVRWPVGQAVRHEAGWTGKVVNAGPPEFPVGLHDGAHAVLGWQAGKPVLAVAVEWEVGGRPAVAWYRPRVLRRVRGAER